MTTLKFTLRSNIGPDIADDAPLSERAAITARIVADLRAAADQIETQGVTGLWENVRGYPGVVGDHLCDADGYMRIGYALKRDVKHNTNDIHGPACPAKVQ